MHSSNGQERLSSNAALVIVDVQKGWDWLGITGRRNNPGAERKIGELLVAWRKSGRPVFHIKHESKIPGSPFRRGQPGNEIKAEVKPMAGEAVISKSVNSAFIGTDLEKRLRDAGISEVVITGILTEHCVSTTARMSGNLGFKTLVVSDATVAHERVGVNGERYSADLVHEVSLATLDGEFAEILDSTELLKRLDGTD